MKITNLKKSFSGRLVVDLPSFTIEKGQIYVLWGQNGFGKSTFFRILAGIMTPDEGVVEDCLSISYQPQNPYIFNYNCYKSVMLGSKNKDTAKALEILEYLGLSDRLDVKALSLSGGQRQCMYLARSLLTDGELLLLDEPFSAIDAIRSDDIARYTLEYCKSQGRTLMVVVHKYELLEIFGKNRLVFSETGKVNIESEHPKLPVPLLGNENVDKCLNADV